jgi:hypothetical protein
MPSHPEVHLVPLSRFLLALAVTAAVLTPGAATAAEAEGAGWWTASPVPVAPPDSTDGLVVQGGPTADQPVSYAAVQFALSDGEIPSHLTLTTAPSSASTPATTLTVCPISGSFVPADGGAIADAPKYDCTTKASSPATAGAYSFDLSSLSAASGTLALAVLPGAPSDRVVLSKPGSDALETSGGSASGSTGDDGTFVADGGTGTVDSFGSASTPAVPVSSFEAPATGSVAVTPLDPPAVGASTSGSSSSAAAATAEPAATASSSSGDGDGRSALPLVFVVLVLLAAALWTAAGRMAPAPEAAGPEVAET